MAVEEPLPKVEPACEGGDVAATLAPGASPPLGLDGPRHGAGGRNEKQAVAVAVAEGSRWSARSTHSSLASSRQRRTSAASGSSSLPRPPAPACASCDTSTSV
jgi:hypothetical protein